MEDNGQRYGNAPMQRLPAREGSLLGFMPDSTRRRRGPSWTGMRSCRRCKASRPRTCRLTSCAQLAAPPTGSYATMLLDGTRRLLASTNSAIYEATGATWTDRSRGGGYTGVQRQRYCTFGNNVLATNAAKPSDRLRLAVPSRTLPALPNLHHRVGQRLCNGVRHERWHLRRPS